MPSSVVMPESGMYTKVANSQNAGGSNGSNQGSSSPPTKSTWMIWKKKINKFMNEPAIQVFMGALLMLTLFMSDSWILGNAPDSQNPALYGVLLAIFIIFMLEMIVLTIVQDGYLWSFFFWMDLLGNASIILDIGWISGKFIPEGTVASQGSVVRATRAAKLGARYGRLLRIMRFTRFVKFLPCFRGLDMGDDFEPTMASIKKVSDQLSSVLSLRTAALVLILVIIVPFLDYTVNDYSADSWITNFKVIAKNETTSWYDMQNLARKCENFYRPKDSNIKYIYVESPWFSTPLEYSFKTREVQRSENVIKYLSEYQIDDSILLQSGNTNAASYANAQPGSVATFNIELHLDKTYENQQNSMFNILTIILVLVVLFTFTASFNQSVNTLVVRPLEKMMTTLRNSAMVMLQSMKAVAKEEEKKEDKPNKLDGDEEEDDDEELETAMLEKMVEKLARIVKHVLPGNNELAVDGNIDKNTANWLNQSYTTGPAFHNPKETKTESVIGDENVEKLRLKQIEEIIPFETREILKTWDFDVLNYSNEELSAVVFYIFSKMNLLDEHKVPEANFKAFCNEICNRYINNTYHNYKHGVDVCFTSWRLLVVPNLTLVLSSLEVFSVLVGALAHDVGHPGLNNLFLVKSKHELAMSHNDRSPLENMHCVVLYEIVSKDATNIFVGLDKNQWRDVRKVILTIILGTDMSHHFEQISKTQLFLEVNGEDTKGFCAGTKDDIDCLKDEKNRLFLMELVLHCSDISNPFKPYALCAKWADLVVEEFCLQGDKEKSMGLEVSPMCDRDSINLCNMQMGFIEFVVAPLIIAFVNVLPPLHEIGSNMLNNFQSWGEKRKMEIMNDDKSTLDKPEECRKLDERLGKFRDKMSFVNNFRELPVRRNSLNSLK